LDNSTGNLFCFLIFFCYHKQPKTKSLIKPIPGKLDMSSSLSNLLKELASNPTVLLTTISGVVILINNFIKEGILFTRKKLKDSEQISYITELKYLDTKAIDNCKNSIIFRAITGKQTPIHIVNLIFNCYDPALAIYIYSKAVRYIQFDDKGQLLEPKIVRNKSANFALYILIALSSSLILLGYSGLDSLGSYHPNASSDANALNAIHIFINIFSVFFIIAVLFGLWGLNYSLNELTFLAKVRKFYDDYRLWKADQDRKQQVN
jgi:uncharacterized membrane protein YqjE